LYEQLKKAAKPLSKAAAFIFAALLLALLIAHLFLNPRAPRPLVEPWDEPLVDRARLDADSAFGTRAGEATKSTVPIVTRQGDRSCVEFRSTRRDQAGEYRACYDGRSGELVEEKATAGF
jgi:hypothetical protein